jgi:hypothetical protein
MMTLLFAALAFAARASIAMAWDPIGNGDDLGDAPCYARELTALPNRSGEVATVRRVLCTGDMLNTVVVYFVFVHKVSERNNHDNLVFRYTTSDGYRLTAPYVPKLAWAKDSALNIALGDGVILQVTKQRASIDGVGISYSLGKAQYPPALEWWQRLSGPDEI